MTSASSIPVSSTLRVLSQNIHGFQTKITMRKRKQPRIVALGSLMRSLEVDFFAIQEPHFVTVLGHANCPPPWHTFARFYTQKEQCKKLPFFERVFSRPMKLGVQNTLSTLLLHDD